MFYGAFFDASVLMSSVFQNARFAYSTGRAFCLSDFSRLDELLQICRRVENSPPDADKRDEMIFPQVIKFSFRDIQTPCGLLSV